MYLREMGSVELLSREGEIAIAKRIEAGRETMIEGLCESPLTFQAIIIWRDQLANAEILLRDIIDLEATYAGPDAKQAAPVIHSEIQRPLEKKEEPKAAAKPAPQARLRTATTMTTTCPRSREAPQDPVEEEDDDFENSLSLSADGSGAEAAGGGDVRPHRRCLWQDAQDAGPARRGPACR